MACYIATKQDAAVAAFVQGWDGNDVARLRGMWEEQKGKSFDMSDPQKAAKMLVDHRSSLLVRQMNTSSEHMTDSYLQLRDLYLGNPEAKMDRVNMIASLFSRVLDHWQAAGDTHTREELCNGYEEDGITHGGQFRIFETVYNQLRNMYASFMSEGDAESAEEIRKVLDNWGAFTAFARIVLRDTEGVKLGNRIDYADTANDGNFGENDIAAIFNPEETTREGWQEVNDFVSAFGSIGKAVRRVLGGIQMFSQEQYEEDVREGYDNPGYVVDDLGFAKRLNPVTAHQALMEELRGVTTETEMMNRLKNSRFEWASQVVQLLEANGPLRTQFFQDFHKDFQPYRESRITLDKGLYLIKSFIMNRVQNLLGGEYKTRIKLGKTLGTSSVYNSDKTVNWQNIGKLRATIDEWFTQASRKAGIGDAVIKERSKFWSSTTSWATRGKIVSDIAQSLGISLDQTTAIRILKGKNGNKFTRAIQELFSHEDSRGNTIATGFDALLSSEELEGLQKGDYSKLEGKAKTFRDLYSSQTATQKQTNSKKGNIEEKVERLLDLIAEEREMLRMESRVLHKDKNGKSNTMFSNVNPSYLGSFISRINSYARAGDKTGLRKFLDEMFGNSSIYKLNGKWLNKWLEDLYNDDLAKDGNFAETLMFSRFLGSNETDFENFTSKQHAIDMLHEFFFAENSRDPKGKAYAHYPVFILGDSGVCKYIKAKRYTASEIIDGMFNIYVSERRRQELVKAANEKMQKDGYQLIENASSKTDEFTLLPFLNDPEVRKSITEAVKRGTSEEEAVKKAIREYMNTAFETFKQDLASLGVLDMVETTSSDGKSKVQVPKYFSRELAQRSDKNFDKLIADFYWNTKFATMQQLQIMTVDPSFYRGTKDLQKRYKEIHAPGASLSVEATWTDGSLFCGKDENGNPITYETCVYFDDIELDADDFNPEFMEAIRANLPSSQWEAYLHNTLTDGQGYRTLDSYRKVMGMAGKWTQEMQSAYDEIKKLRTTYGNSAIPAEELERIAGLAVVFQPIKPYMYTLENYSINDTEMLKIPVQHKYAEAVLIPELLPQGSMLRDLALAMENHVDEYGKPQPIDLVGSTKIVKVGNFGATSLKGVKDAGEVQQALASGYVHKLNYSDYRIQSNVPEHINSSQLFGTQLRKLIMANIKLDSDRYESYVGGQEVNLGNGRMVKLNGRNLLNFYNALIVSNILSSYHEFEDEMSDPRKLADILQQAVINNGRESMDNLLAFSVDEQGNFHIPLFEGGLEHDAAALLMSLFKKAVNKQRIKGGSAVQVSAMGIKGYEEDGDLKYVTSEDGKNILYAECEVPWDLSVKINGKEVALKFSDYCNEDGTLKVDGKGNTLIEKRFPGILDRIAYRIPTERDYSMINLKIKRFSQKTAGGTIKVPAQGTTIAGFDFDIDKLYFMMREYHFEKSAETKLVESIMGQFTNSELADDILQELNEDALLTYDLSKSPLEQHKDPAIAKALRNNMLIDLIQKRLEDPETFSQRYTPGGFRNSSSAAREMRELLYGPLSEIYSGGQVNFSALNERAKDKKKDPEPNYDPTDPMTIIRYNQQNQVAGKLIGIFANQNTNHAFASLMREFKLAEPISFCGHSYSDLLHAPSGVDVDLNVAELLSASVDAVKDPVLNFLNLNTVTADAGGMLARLGYTPREIGLLFNQPIIKELCDYVFNNGTMVTTAISELRSFYLSKLKELGESEEKITSDSFSASTLANQIVEDRVQRESAKSAEDLTWNAAKIKSQLQVLNLFEEISGAAGEVSQFVTNTKFSASNAVGSTFGDMYSQQIKVANYVESFSSEKRRVLMKVTDTMTRPLSQAETVGMSDEDYINGLIGHGIGNPFAYEQAMYDMNVRAIRLLSKYFPYETSIYKAVRRMAAEITKGQYLDADTINNLHSDMMVYMLSQQEGSMFNGDRLMPVPISGERISYRDYYTKVFPERVFNVLESDPSYKTDYAIFRYMIPVENENGQLELRVQDVGGLTPTDKDAIRDSWAALMQDDPNLARDLFLYNYYKLGFGFSPRAFMHLAPVAVKESIMIDGETSYVDFMNKVLNGGISSFNSAEFMKQFIRNHSDNRRFVYTARGEFGKVVRTKAKPGRTWLPSFEIGISEMGDNTSILISGDPMTKGSKTAVSFMPCIAFQDGNSTILYMASTQDSDKRFNVGEGGTMTYVRVGKLGTTNKSLQYESTTPISQGEALPEEIPTGSTTADNTPEAVHTPIDRQAYVAEIVEALIQRDMAEGVLMAEDVEAIKKDYLNQLSSVSDEDLIDTLNAIRSQSTDGMIDKTGQKIC